MKIKQGTYDECLAWMVNYKPSKSMQGKTWELRQVSKSVFISEEMVNTYWRNNNHE
jgi:hypothetical protein